MRLIALGLYSSVAHQSQDFGRRQVIVSDRVRQYGAAELIGTGAADPYDVPAEALIALTSTKMSFCASSRPWH